MVETRRLALDGLIEVRPHRFADERGFFTESWNERTWAEAGMDEHWVQDNHSYSKAAGVLRGLHYQTSPMAQAKLVRVVAGAIHDVCVDIRRGSDTFGRWAAIKLSAKEGNQLYIPAGFAHGFLTLEPHSEVEYKVSASYSTAHERAIRYDDPHLAIDWPKVGVPILSDRDRAAPTLLEQEKDLL